MLRTSSRKRKGVDPFVPGQITAKEQARAKKISHSMVLLHAKRRQALQTAAQPSPLLYFPLPPPNPFGIHVPTTGTSEERVVAGIKDVMTAVVGNGKKQYKATMVANILKDGTLYEECGMQAASDLTTSIGKMLFRPWKFAQAIASKGSINGQAVNATRQILCPTPWKRVMIQSAKKVHEEENLLEEWGEKERKLKVLYLPVNIDGKKAEGWGFDVETMFYYCLKKYGLLELAQTDGIEVKITFDGAELTGQKGHTCIGMQFVDKRTKDPTSEGETLLYYDADGNPQNFQSRDGCVMLRIALVNETKGMVKDYFGDIFEFVKETGLNGLPGDGTPDRPAIRPVHWVGCHDKSAIWKISIGGGGCFNAHHHCNMCEQSKHELVTFCESEYRCSACKLTNRARCRHWEVNDKEEVARKEVELSMLLHDWQEQTKARRQQDCDDSDSDDSPQIPQVDESPIPFEDLIDNVMHIEENKQIQAISKLIVDPGHATRTLDPLHIDFLALNQEQTRTFNSLLLEESELRGLTVNANESLSDRRLCLRRLLLQGLRIKIATK
eukprot:scaffold71387_cov58-Attheya_sp.AAC.5